MGTRNDNAPSAQEERRRQEQLPFDPTPNQTTARTRTTDTSTARNRTRLARRRRCFSAMAVSVSKQYMLLILMLRICLCCSQGNTSPTNSPAPTIAPTVTPTVSKAPSPAPTASPHPTTSPQPSKAPSSAPTDAPSTSSAPSLVPSISLHPSSAPSPAPSSAPSISQHPSLVPSISSAPSSSFAPTIDPTLPTVAPSSAPSTIIPTTPGPTVQPTPLLPPITEPRLFVKLQNMPKEFTAIGNDPWRRLTTDHVRNYWRSFGDQNPIYILRTVTMPIEEKWEEPTSSSRRRNLQNQDTNPTGTITITYGQEATFQLREEGVLPYPGYTQSDIFTMPFSQYPKAYTLSLQTLFNTTADDFQYPFIFLEDSGLATDTSSRSESDKATIAATVTVTVLVLCLAGGYIFYVTKYKHRSHSSDGSGEEPIVGAVIGVNPNENIIISESYDEEFNDDYPSGKKGDAEYKKMLPDRNEAGVASGSDDEPIVPKDLMASPSEDAAFVTLSNANLMSPGDIGTQDANYASGSPIMTSLQGYTAGGSQLQLDPDAVAASSSMKGSGSEEERDEEVADESEQEPSVPFMGFQMEIQDLE